MQFNLFLAYFQFGLPLLTIGILLTILRVIAVKRYRAERLTEGKTTSMGNLGKKLANTQFLTFNITWSVTLAVGLLFVVMSLLMPFFEQLGYENMMLPLAVFALGLMVIDGLFYAATVRGRAILWRGRIISNYKEYGHQEWVIQKRLAGLVREKEGSDRFRAKVAQRALESLMAQEDMTGDAVRRIMADPAGPIDRFEDRTIPSTLWQFKFSLSLMTFSYVGVLAVFWASTVGIISDFSVTTTAVIIFMGLVLLSVCCMLTEGYMASRKRMRFLLEKDSP
ncbi:MAG: hypothetical protein ACFFFC_18370 [Candidatus Thorarchaeota archaeon]